MTSIPTPESVHPPLIEIRNRRNALHTKRTALVAEASTVREELRRGSSQGNESENRIRAILGEPSLPSATPGQKRLETLLIEIQDLNAAIGILDAQLREQHAVASRIVCDSVRTLVKQRANAFAKAYLAVYAAHSEYDQLIDDVESTGANVSSLGRIWPSSLGSVRDLTGPYHYTFTEFAESGALQKSDVPEAVR